MKTGKILWAIIMLIIILLFTVSLGSAYDYYYIVKHKGTFREDRFIITFSNILKKARGNNYLFSGRVLSNNAELTITQDKIKSYDQRFPVFQKGDTMNIWYSGMLPKLLVPRFDSDTFPEAIIQKNVNKIMYFNIGNLVIFIILVYKRKAFWLLISKK